jgi:predicted SAM-dependent methyltransferase
MKNQIKEAIYRALLACGFEVHRVRLPDDGSASLPLYRQLYGEEAVASRRFYNIGSGKFKHKAWTSVDYVSDLYAKYAPLIDIQWDISDGTALDVHSETAHLCYTSHTIEHLQDHHVEHMFDEVYRVLRPGGLFRVTCPNIDLYYRAWRDNDINFFPYPTTYESHGITKLFLCEFAGQLATPPTASKIADEELVEKFSSLAYEDALNWVSSQIDFEVQRRNPGQHVSWWNHRKAERFLQKAGFSAIYLSGYGQSRNPGMRDIKFFDSTWPHISMYIEARK